MTPLTLLRRSLRFHARAHLGVAFGAAIGSAALIGALVVGDSVRGSLRQRALDRVGTAQCLLEGRDRLFSDSTKQWLRAFGLNDYALGLHLPATASAREGAARANRVDLYGINPDFWGFAPEPARITVEPGNVLLSRTLASRLGVVPGDTILLRFRKPSAVSAEVPLSPRAGNSLALRFKVQSILTPEQFGNFSPFDGSVPPLNAFVRLDELQQGARLEGRANFMFEAGVKADLRKPFYALRSWLSDWLEQFGIRPPAWLSPTSYRNVTPQQELLTLAFILSQNWSLADAGLTLSVLEPQHVVELKSQRVFLDPPVVRVLDATPFGRAQIGLVKWPTVNEQPILTYLANFLRTGTNLTPYSMVTAAGPPYTPPDLKDDEIILSRWLADDLHAQPGDQISLAYFDPESGASLVERTNRLRVHSVVPLEPPWADRTLMPDFPGIEKAESTRDWDTGFPLTYKIRPQDEEYWKKYRGTPKAFITLAAGQTMWGNRFGNLTTIRVPVPPDTSPSKFRDSLAQAILASVKPEELGLRFEPVREQALKAAGQSQDFGQLFLGFSIFLVAAALLLMALLFQFGLEQRAAEVGTFLALGFTAKEVRRLLLVEGAALALVAGLLGALGGLAYARAMLWGLTTVWHSAVGTSALKFHASLVSLFLGTFASTLVAVVTIWLTLRRQARQPARELLAGEVQSPKSKVQTRAKWIALGSGAGALALIAWLLAGGQTANAGAFFSAGALFLVTGLAFAAAWLSVLARKTAAARFTVAGLGLRACARRRTRSLATIALLASGAFVIVAIGVFRLDANRDAAKPTSGTGGFGLLGQSTLPVVQDLNTKSGREFFGLGAEDMAGVRVVPFRVREGDDASCLNLNRAQKPRLLGVRPELLQGRFSFANAARGLSRQAGWDLLRTSRREEVVSAQSKIKNQKSKIEQSLPSARAEAEEIPAIGDANSIEWALGKNVGDTIDYTDDRGRAFKLRLVAAVANSILQGSLVIDETEFIKRFPNESGYRMFLLDAPSASVAQVSATLSRALQDVGLELTPTVERLNAFNAVQNTYLGTFQVLGGLGLLLGSAGLGVVVLRNVLERRGELGLLVAVGFRRRALEGLVLSEHGALLGLGLGVGILSAAIAVLPELLSPGRQLPYVSLVVTLAAVLLNGALWTWLATRYALRGNLLEALRNE